MAYTNLTFDPATPTDTDLASLGDNEIRKLKLDIKERLESYFESFDDDPLVPKAGVPVPSDNEIEIGVEAGRPADAVTSDVKFYFATDSKVLSINNGATWLEYKLSDIGTGGTTVEDVTFGQFKGIKLSSGKSGVSCAGSWIVDTLNISPGGTGLNFDNHILLAIRFKVKQNGESYLDKWAYVTSKDPNELTGGDFGMLANPLTDVTLTLLRAQLIYGSNPPQGTEHYVKLDFFLQNESGSSKVVDYLVDLFFIAFT